MAMLKYALLVVVAVFFVTAAYGKNICLTNTFTDPIGHWFFGLQDSDDGVTPTYDVVFNTAFNGKINPYGVISNAYYQNIFNYMVNVVPLSGGLGYTKNEDLQFIRTANFTCVTDFSAIFGPAYPDFRDDDGGTRGRFRNLEAYIHYSAPPQTNYIRSVLFVKNTGDTTERVHLAGDWFTTFFSADLSEVSNDGRYFVMFPWAQGDLGENGDDPASTFTTYPTTLHIGGANARYTEVSFIDNMNSQIVAPVDYAELSAGQEIAWMFIISLGRNRNTALRNAVEIDAEPAFIFHDLNADQLSLIRNWGGCQAVLAPNVTVTVQAPSQCSSDLTSDFTVTVTTTRTDFTTGFTHRVVLVTGDQLTGPQTSNTIMVPNDVGAVKHQLWYRDCLIKETPFTTCDTVPPTPMTPASSAPVSASSPGTPTSKPATSGASSTSFNIAALSIFALLSTVLSIKSVPRSSLLIVCAMSLFWSQHVRAQNVCENVFPAGGDPKTPAKWYFGTNDGDGSALYSVWVTNGWASYYDYSVLPQKTMFWSEHAYYINGIQLVGGKNYTVADPTRFVATANFTCLSDYSAYWGPAYPSYTANDFNARGQFQNLETYVYYSAPSATSYVRSILFITNVGDTAERVRLFSDWRAYDYTFDRSSLNEGRYFTAFPWQEGDLGANATNPADSYTNQIESIHVSGPNGRDKKSRVAPQTSGTDHFLGPVYYTTLPAGQQMALMYITSYGTNLQRALLNAAEIDLEPVYIFHDLNADQLSLIRNWGGCQAVLAPNVTVNVQEPSQCSSGATSDFTVTVTTTRTDFTTGFTHRVVAATGTQVVAPQSSTTLTVRNNIGPVTHQLWYKECLVKETSFTACTN